MVLFVSALNAMHVDVLRGEYFCNILINSNIPLAFKTVAIYRGLFGIISLEEQRKTSHVKEP